MGQEEDLYVAALTRAQIRAEHNKHYRQQQISRQRAVVHRDRVLAARWAMAHNRREQSPRVAAAWDSRLARAGVDVAAHQRAVAEQRAHYAQARAHQAEQATAQERQRSAHEQRQEQRDHDWTAAYMTAAAGAGAAFTAAVISAPVAAGAVVEAAHPGAELEAVDMAAAPGTVHTEPVDSAAVTADAHPHELTLDGSEDSAPEMVDGFGPQVEAEVDAGPSAGV